MSVKFKAFAIGIIALLFIFAMFILTYQSASNQEFDSLGINLAGRQRMLSQRITKDIAFLGLYPQDEAIKASAQNAITIFDDTLSALLQGGDAPLTLDPAGERSTLPAAKGPLKEKLLEVQSLWNEMATRCQAVIAAGGEDEEGIQYLKQKNLLLLKTMNEAVILMQRSGEQKIASLIRNQSIIFILALVVFTWIGFSSRLMVKCLVIVNRCLKKVADGDMTDPCRIRRSDEIGDLAHSENKIVAFFADLVRKIKGSSESLNMTVRLLEENTFSLRNVADHQNDRVKLVKSNCEKTIHEAETLEQNSSQLNDSISSLAAAAEEMAINISQIAQSAEQAKGKNQEANNASQTSLDQVQDLSEAVSRIGGVINKIQEIADQTNLLALNATIEASRAGESGKGFAVVANEIKELARESSDATEEIISRIEDINQTSQHTIELIEAISGHVNGSNEITDQISIAISEQADVSQDLSRHIQLASNNVEEVDQGSKTILKSNQQIAEDLLSMEQSVRRTEAEIQNIEELSEELSFNRDDLINSIDTLNIGDVLFDIGSIKLAHFKWKMRINLALNGFEDLDPETMPSPHACELGKWYDGMEHTFMHSKTFKELGQVHRQVHKLMKEAAIAMRDDEPVIAATRNREFGTQRIKLFQLLNDLYLEKTSG